MLIAIIRLVVNELANGRSCTGTAAAGNERRGMKEQEGSGGG
jgi:hypothetical protein